MIGRRASSSPYPEGVVPLWPLEGKKFMLYVRICERGEGLPQAITHEYRQLCVSVVSFSDPLLGVLQQQSLILYTTCQDWKYGHMHRWLILVVLLAAILNGEKKPDVPQVANLLSCSFLNPGYVSMCDAQLIWGCKSLSVPANTYNLNSHIGYTTNLYDLGMHTRSWSQTVWADESVLLCNASWCSQGGGHWNASVAGQGHGIVWYYFLLSCMYHSGGSHIPYDGVKLLFLTRPPPPKSMPST